MRSRWTAMSNLKSSPGFQTVLLVDQLARENTQLKAEIERLRAELENERAKLSVVGVAARGGDVSDCEEMYRTDALSAVLGLRADLTTAQARIERLGAALRRYGKHENDLRLPGRSMPQCGVVLGEACNCGLSEAFRDAAVI
jgi:uncharacterized small protein (DUF1192 family)